MAYLKRFHYPVISLTEAMEGLFANGRLSPGSVVLSFDDGYESFEQFALPVLREHGFPAVVFIVAKRIGKSASFLNPNEYPEQPSLMDTAALRRIHGQGIEIGSHGATHAELTGPDEQMLIAEIVDSKKIIADSIQAPVDHFCYPRGNYTAAAARIVATAGYRSGVTCIRGAANAASNAFEIPRKAVSYGDTLLGFWWKLHMKNRPKRSRQNSGTP